MCEMTLLPILCPFDPPGIYPTLTPHIGCRVGYRVQQDPNPGGQMDRRGFVTTGMAAGLVGATSAGSAIAALLENTPGWAPRQDPGRRIREAQLEREPTGPVTRGASGSDRSDPERQFVIPVTSALLL